ncbi:MAG: potassium transporter TrkG [Chloroflexota bacterium]|nr:potassium transporter TrkG [Chloroflexota bacterium]
MKFNSEEKENVREGWSLKPGDRVVRHPRQDEIQPIQLTVPTPKVPSRALGSPLLIIYAFAGLIVIGTFLLLMPFTTEGGEVSVQVAAFTAASAVTVTGLVVKDTAEYWTRGGQIIILSLMFIGGLGFMTIGTFLLILIGQKVTLSQRLLVKESLGVNQIGDLAQLTVGIVILAVAIQLIGFIALLSKFILLYPLSEAVWQAAFHAISGFNNAGFVALNEEAGLTRFRSDWLVLGTIGILSLLGAISYWVIVDVMKERSFALLTLTAKLVLIFTFVLVISTAIVFFFFEYDNPNTLASMSLSDKILTSLFESISGRTAGFTPIDFGQTKEETNFFMSGVMFIGGASGSVAGGIKINTFAIIVIAVLAAVRGRSHASIFAREIPQSLVQRALVIGAVSISFVFLVVVALSFSETDFDFIDLFFEGVSAAGTVGLSTGITPDLSSVGQIILMIAMFIGRLGPLAIGLAMAQRTEPDIYRYAQEQVTIG